VTALATFYIKKIKEIQKTGPYHIAGYSFGASIAVEIVIQLEKESNKVGSLVLLDGSHRYVTAQTKSYQTKREITNGAMNVEGESDSLCTYLNMMINIDYKKERETMMGLKDLDERVKYAVKLLSTELPKISENAMSKAMNSFYRKLIASDVYEPKGKLATAPLLIRASTNDMLTTLGEDYQLNQISRNPAVVHSVEGSHQSFIKGRSAEDVSEIIAKHLKL
jgi:fatty acid synthase